mmetsp:Transcript_66196/g.132814  ORF Transcript_66196/g.132814 Transcript_66196/m.132814 type:complete len:223 (+) Transcript_66196:159-827(+)
MLAQGSQRLTLLSTVPFDTARLYPGIWQVLVRDHTVGAVEAALDHGLVAIPRGAVLALRATEADLLAGRRGHAAVPLLHGLPVAVLEVGVPALLLAADALVEALADRRPERVLAARPEELLLDEAHGSALPRRELRHPPAAGEGAYAGVGPGQGHRLPGSRRRAYLLLLVEHLPSQLVLLADDPHLPNIPLVAEAGDPALERFGGRRRHVCSRRGGKVEGEL